MHLQLRRAVSLEVHLWHLQGRRSRLQQVAQYPMFPALRGHLVELFRRSALRVRARARRAAGSLLPMSRLLRSHLTPIPKHLIPMWGRAIPLLRRVGNRVGKFQVNKVALQRTLASLLNLLSRDNLRSQVRWHQQVNLVNLRHLLSKLRLRRQGNPANLQ